MGLSFLEVSLALEIEAWTYKGLTWMQNERTNNYIRRNSYEPNTAVVLSYFWGLGSGFDL